MKTAVAALSIMVMLAGCREKAGQPETETTGTTQAAQETSTATATTTGATGGTVSALSPDDKEFMSKAGVGGLAEVKMGNLALAKASSADVKSFGQRMVSDHSKANEELQQLATAKGVALPTELDGEHKGALDHLTSLSGAEFDKAYMQHMVADHEKDVSEFEKASTSASDSDLKAWAGKTLPTLKDHLQLAQTVSGKVK
jgi:putative membrane protein